MRRVIAIRHVAFEDLGVFGSVLQARGWDIEYVDAATSSPRLDLQHDPTLVFVLGGPISVHDREIFAFLDWERALLRERLAHDLPTIGICLGAQLMAVALNAQISAMPRKEVGFSPVALTEAGKVSSLSVLASKDVSVLHWHGEEISLPAGAQLLASTSLCATQAFSYGNNCLALQFHLEADMSTLERWYVGHTAELSHAGIEVPALRLQAASAGAKLRKAAELFLDRWLEGLNLQE